MLALNNYWDWLWPYFKSSGFAWLFYSWQDVSLGRPTGYASAWWMELLLRNINFFNPEIIQWAIWLLLLALIYGLFRLYRPKINIHPFLFLALFLNPAIFYKLLAGHLYYIFAYFLFFFFIYFLLLRKKDRLTELVVPLLLAIIGLQIQFFFITAIVLFIYFLFRRKELNWKYLLLLIIVPILINLPWLSNYLVGANSLVQNSQVASAVGFKGSVYSSVFRNFFMIFSSATDIQYVFDRWTFVYFGLFSLLLFVIVITYFWFIRKKEGNNSQINITVVSLVVFFLLGTGAYQSWPIPGIRLFYPIFREAGHLAPIILFFEFLTFALIWPKFIEMVASLRIAQKLLKNKGESILAGSAAVYLGIFLAVNGFYFWRYLPFVDFSAVRQQFASIEKFNSSSFGSYRVLTYPFWNQYGLASESNLEKNGRLLNNSGWDSFMEFSGKELYSNYQAGGQSIHDTLQYRLLKTGDLTELEEKNIRYIYDLSKIYQSNFDRYTLPETYDSDISFIKNSPDLFENLIAKNPAELSQVQDGVYEVKNVLPRLYLENANPGASLEFEKINPSQYLVRLNNFSKGDLIFLNNFHPGWRLYLNKGGSGYRGSCEVIQSNTSKKSIECQKSQNSNPVTDLRFLNDKSLFTGSQQKEFDYANKWRLNGNELKDKSGVVVDSNGNLDLEFTLFFQPQAYLWVALFASFATTLIMLLLVLKNLGKRKI